MSKPYAEVIGDPIAHSKSPLIHNFWLGKLGIDAEYRACHVRPDELADYFAQRRADPHWRGCNVTIPHKESIAALVDEIDARTAGIGASNCVWKDGLRLRATNTDVDGVAEAVASRPLTGRGVIVIGGGGAARAAFAHLAQIGGSRVTVLARNAAKAREAAKANGLEISVLPLDQAPSALAGAALLINATQLGMTGQESMPDSVIGALSAMADDGLVFDMVYAPLETELLRAARARLLATSDGLVMLIGQAANAFAHFFGRLPDRSDDAELRGQLTS